MEAAISRNAPQTIQFLSDAIDTLVIALQPVAKPTLARKRRSDATLAG